MGTSLGWTVSQTRRSSGSPGHRVDRPSPTRSEDFAERAVYHWERTGPGPPPAFLQACPELSQAGRAGRSDAPRQRRP